MAKPIAIVLALSALLAIGLPMWSGRVCSLTPEIRTQLELSQLSNAVAHYKLRTGELFPATSSSEHILHIQMAYPYANEIKEHFEQSGLDLGTLDDSEALVLYLSGKIEGILGRRGNPVFEFEEERLTDLDEDGFCEFASIAEETYRFDGNLPLVYSPALHNWIATPPYKPKGEGQQQRNLPKSRWPIDSEKMESLTRLGDSNRSSD